MTDYRLRNHDLLCAERGARVLSLRNVLVFGAIAVTVSIGVIGHLTDRFNTSAASIATVPSSRVAQHTGAPQPALSLPLR